jgi:RNA polymerase-binding transcription factor DksA
MIERQRNHLFWVGLDGVKHYPTLSNIPRRTGTFRFCSNCGKKTPIAQSEFHTQTPRCARCWKMLLC